MLTKEQGGLCECGCGCPTKLAEQSNTELGHVRGQPVRFVPGHNLRRMTGSDHPSWRGGRLLDVWGYMHIKAAGHPNANNNGYVREHILVVMNARDGRPLPPKAEVHHVNENKRDNRPGNLVVCPDRSYHMLLHQRQRALDACGNANWLKCPFCKRYDDPAVMYVPGKPKQSAGHRACRNKYNKEHK